MSIAQHQPSTDSTTDPDRAKFAADSVVRVLGDVDQHEFKIIERHFLWSHGRREYHYRLFRGLGNGMAERQWKRESEIEGVGE